MKKNLLISMLVAIVVLTSCSKGSPESDFTVDTTEYKFNLSTGEDATRSNVQFSPERYIMAVYDAHTGNPVPCFDNFTAYRKTVGGRNFQAMLQADKTYDLVFWADDGKSFNTDDFSAVRLARGARMNGNAYYAFGQFSTIKAVGVVVVNYLVRLNRAVAGVEFFESVDVSAVNDPKRTVDLTVEYEAKTFDAFTGNTSNFTDNSVNIYSKVTNNVDPEVKTSIGLFYVFASKRTDTRVLKIGAGDNELKDFEIEVTADQVTTVNGKFYNFDVAPTFNVDTDWDEGGHDYTFEQ